MIFNCLPYFGEGIRKPSNVSAEDVLQCTLTYWNAVEMERFKHLRFKPR